MNSSSSNVLTPASVLGTWPTGRMRALQFSAPGELSVADVEAPEPARGHVLVRVKYVGICGTDVHLLSGESAYVVGGVTRYPIRFGHEWSGEVVAAASDVDPNWLGQTVVGEPFLSCGHCRTCRSGHYNLCPDRAEMGVRGQTPGAAAEWLRVPAANVAVVPSGVPADQAVIAEPSVTVLHAYESAHAQPGELVAVLGTGAVGLIAVQVGSFMGCHVHAVGIDEAGLAAAQSLGAEKALHPDEVPTDAYDVVMEATGSTGIGPTLTRIAAIAGRLIQIGIAGRPVQDLDLAAFVSKGLSLRGVLGGVHLLPRALNLIAAGGIRPDDLIEAVIPVWNAHDAFARTSRARRRQPKVVLDLSAFANATLASSAHASA